MKLPPSLPHPFRAAHLPLCLLAALLLFPLIAGAQTSYWNTATGGALFTNAANWIGNVPDAGMTAAFTNTVSLYALTIPANTTNANVLVGAPQSSSIKINNSGGDWWISNELNIGTLAGQTGSFEFATGSLVVTNAAGTGQITVGGPGKGTLSFNQGSGSASVVADYLVATNSVLNSVTNSILSLGAGKLTTLRGSTLILATNMAAQNIGTVLGREMTWLMLGGTNMGTYAGGNRTINFGNAVGATGTVVVAGSGTIWSNVMADANRVDLVVGANTAGVGQLVISNNAYVYTKGNLTMKGTNGLVLIAGGGSLDVSANNNGSFSGFGNTVLVSNQNSRFTVNTQILGSNSPSNQWIVADGATISAVSAIYVGGGSNGVGNSIQILGTNSLGTSSTFTTTGSLGIDTGIGGSGSPNAAGVGRSNYILVANGGKLTGGASSDIWIGYYGDSPGARMLITNGGTVSVRNIQLGYGTNVAYGSLLVDGPGSVASVAQLAVGTNTFSAGAGVVNKGSGRALIQNGGTLEVISGGGIYSGIGGAGVISNLGGVFRFLSANPTISNYGQTASILLQDGTVVFRNVGAAVVNGNVTNLTYLGTNILRLDSSTNSSLGYYQVGGAGQPFSILDLAGTNALWNTGTLNLAADGEIRASNSVGAAIAALVTNAGTVRVVNSVLTWRSNVVMNGGSFLTQNGTNQFTKGLTLANNSSLTLTNGTSRMTGVISNNFGSTIQAINSIVTWQDAVVLGGQYYSDPSTNIFVTNVTVTASGSMYGSNGDLFVFQKDLFMQSTNRVPFSLSQAAVLFTNGPSHLLSISNSGALDLGHFTNFSMVAQNFAIGQLSIAAGDRVTLAGNTGSNALYVGWLDIHGLINTNDYTSITNGLVAALNLPNINLYYNVYDSRNDWLTRWLPSVTGAGYDLWGGGLLLPIPEPSPLLALGLGLSLLVFLRLRR